MRTVALVVMAMLAGACGDDDDAGGTPDAAAAAVDAFVADAFVADAHPASGAHKLYLNFEGQALTMGPDDATMNVSVMLDGPHTIPAWFPGDAGRDARIAAIADEVRAVLAPYDIEVVTERPAAGPYDMVVIGGLPADAGFDTPGLFGVMPGGDCANSQASQIALIFDIATPDHGVATMCVSAAGAMHGISLTKVNRDCMCYATAECVDFDQPCTIGGPGTLVDVPNSPCAAGATVMDENTRFLSAFGPHP